MRVLSVDCAGAGLSGDMLIAALLAVIDDDVITSYISTINSVCNSQIRIEIDKESLMGHPSNHINLLGTDERIKTGDMKHTLEELFNALDKPELIGLGETMMDILLEAERSVHGEEHPEFHELGTLDTIFDISLSIYLLDHLNVGAINLSSLATGCGVVNTEHGMLPVPAPATLEILKTYQIPTCQGPEGEATTPTGAMLYATMTSQFPRTDAVVWEKIGYGRGTKKWNDRDNTVRIRLGYTQQTHSKINVLETNIDDVSGELLGNAVQLLFDAGALDVSYYPIIMKKNRPAYCLRVVAKVGETEKIAEEIQRLTGSLGIRIFGVDRHIGERSIVEKNCEIDGMTYNYHVKVSKYRTKVEFEDLHRIHLKTGIPIFRLEILLLENQ